ncbi:MAG: transporter substrate-binding domain-containing protein [Bacteroides sp.]|nr:transporter substrate-binding domain-containing protein [Bacteroides sp.]
MRHLKPKYRQTATYILLLLAIFALMESTRRCTHAAPLPTIVKGNSTGDTIDVAIIYGPLSYYLYADTIGGINFDLLTAFSRDAGMPVKMWPVVSLESSLANLEEGTFNILASLPSDNSVKQRFLTTQSVFLDKMALIQLADSAGNIRIKSVLDLANDTVHIQTDSPAGARLMNLDNEIGAHIEVVSDKDLSEEYLCMKVAVGDIRCAVVNEKTAAAMKKRYPLLNYDNLVSFTQFQVWLMNKNDSALLNSVNNWLKEFKETEEYRQIIEKY